MNHLQKKRFLIAFISLWLTIACVGIYQLSQDKVHATRLDTYINVSSSSGTDKIIIGKNYFSPRIQQICNDNMYGVEYNPKMEKRCRVLWTGWANEMKNASPY